MKKHYTLLLLLTAIALSTYGQSIIVDISQYPQQYQSILAQYNIREDIEKYDNVTEVTSTIKGKSKVQVFQHSGFHSELNIYGNEGEIQKKLKADSKDKDVWITDLIKNEKILSFKIKGTDHFAFRQLNFSLNGKYFMAVGYDNKKFALSIYRFNVLTGILEINANILKLDKDISSFEFISSSGDGKYLFVWCRLDILQIDVENNTCTTLDIERPSLNRKFLYVYPDSKYLLLSNTKKKNLYDVENKKHLFKIPNLDIATPSFFVPSEGEPISDIQGKSLSGPGIGLIKISDSFIVFDQDYNYFTISGDTISDPENYVKFGNQSSVLLPQPILKPIISKTISPDKMITFFEAIANCCSGNSNRKQVYKILESGEPYSTEFIKKISMINPSTIPIPLQYFGRHVVEWINATSQDELANDGNEANKARAKFLEFYSVDSKELRSKDTAQYLATESAILTAIKKIEQSIQTPANQIASQATVQSKDENIEVPPSSYSQSYTEEELMAQGVALYQEGKLSDAINKFDAAILKNPKSFNALLYRAICQKESGKLELAIQDSKKLTEFYPEDPTGYTNIAWWYMEIGQYEKAKSYVENAFELGRAYMYAVYINYGNYYLLAGETEKAKFMYLSSISLMTSEDVFPTACDDLDFFIKKGMKVPEASAIKAAFKLELNKNGAIYVKMMNLDLSCADYLSKNNYLEAALASKQASDLALTITPPNYEAAMSFAKQEGDHYKSAAMTEEATNAYQKSIGYIKKGNLKSTKAGTCAHEVAFFFNEIFQFEKAKECYLMALKIYSDANNDSAQALTYSNLADVEQNLGEYDKAIEAAKMAVTLGEKNNNKDLSSIYNNLGVAYNDIGEYNLAYKYFTKALELDQKNNDKAKIAKRLGGIGTSFLNLKNYDLAEAKYIESLKLAQETNSGEDIAVALNNLGMLYKDLKQYDKARINMEQSLELTRKLKNERYIGTNLLVLGQIFNSLHNTYQAEIMLLQAETIFKKLNLSNELSETYYNLACVCVSKDDITNAINYSKKGVAIIESFRSTDKKTSISQLSVGIKHYEILAALYGANGQYKEAFNTIEKAKANQLAKSLSEKTNVSVVSSDKVAIDLPANTALVNYMNTVYGVPVYITISANGIGGYFPKGSESEFTTNFNALLSKYDQRSLLTLKSQRGFKVKPNNQQVLIENAAVNNEKFENLINFYRTLLLNQATDSSVQTEIKEIAKGLYQYLIAPIESQIADKGKLIIIPEGILGYLPFETLIDNEGKYLIEKYDIQYVQSATVWNLIRQRQYDPQRKDLLAFGGAFYDGSGSNDSWIKSESDLVVLKMSVKDKTSQSTLSAYKKLGIGIWQNLPGTLTEVNNIKQIYPLAQILTGANASEAKVVSLSTQGQLSDYKVIHFATHGVVVPSIPELSALVLSQTGNTSQDGYLTTSEIEQLNIKADFVNLSACETGLGKIYGGEGVVGLTQSFLIAGANALSVSLWQVSDESTMKFMTGLYEEVKAGKNYNDAICVMKRKFISGEFGTKNAFPYYWAPFVYYGK